ncbi:olfactomedin-like [Gouania willdenowi]|uniref:Olfactomedin-like n=1 Tax=Gouania willdenowi TaxID=441366 RepID=A0A8C5EEA4_GOUWI|nr:olfactomedin-like [Gouania willdenowi]
MSLLLLSLMLLLMLTSTCHCAGLEVNGPTQRISGIRKGDSCVCQVNSTIWAFPVRKYETVLNELQTCEGSLKNLEEQLDISIQQFPQFETWLANLTTRVQPFQYLHQRGLYTALTLRRLDEELGQLETDIGAVHSQLNSANTHKLSTEMSKLRDDVTRMKMSDTMNMRSVREKLRYLKNSVESSKTIPKDFRGEHSQCYKGLITNISEPVTTMVSPSGKALVSGSWGKQAQENSKEQKNSYWVLPLVSSNIYGNFLRVYPSYEDFLTIKNAKQFIFAPSPTDPKASEGPGAVLYGDALYYHCYRSADICRYDLNTNIVKRATLPGTRVGYNNRFPYCYYECEANSDVDVEADETGLWAIYSTVGNHGNIVVSRLEWDSQTETLNVTQTWETRIFKKAVTNAFMACGVLYATRFVDDNHEEVFYAFDTASSKEDNSLVLPMEKLGKAVSSLSYNPTDKQLYMYNAGYLLAFKTSYRGVVWNP